MSDKAAEWLDYLLIQPREVRLQMAAAAVRQTEDTERGQQCWMQDHDERLDRARGVEDRIIAALLEIDDVIPELSEGGQEAARSVMSRVRRAMHAPAAPVVEGIIT